MSVIKRVFGAVLVLLIIASVGFIFYNSALPPEKSSEQSTALGGVIAEIIPPETELGGFVQKYLRKIAHFTEYGLLGIELAVLCVFFTRRKLISLCRSFFFAGSVALLDETIQILSKRGPSVIDIWIDIGGYVFFSLFTLFASGLVLLVFLLVRKIRGY